MDAIPVIPDSIALKANWGFEKANRKTNNEEREFHLRGTVFGRNVMPGNGRLYRRNYSNKERRALEDLGLEMGLHAGAVYTALGLETCDIYHDHNIFWWNVPSNVWDYHMGGYPVLKKMAVVQIAFDSGL